MLKRTLTGLVILLVTAGFVLLKQINSLFFDAFVLIVMYGALIEVIKAYKLGRKNPHTALLIMVPVLVFVGHLVSRKLYAGVASRIAFGGIFASIAISALMLMLFLTLDILIAGKKRKLEIEQTEKEGKIIDAFESTKISMQILAYPILPLSFFFALNSLPYEISYVGIVLTFVVAMLTDTCAYLFGRAWGKRKFIPEVSPKKTIAGVVGGFVGGIVGAALVYIFFYFTPYFELLKQTSLLMSISAFAIIGLVGSYITQLGDLIASSLKRKVGLKDYANIFPGHGGFMDRFDGQMFVSVISYLVLVFFFV